MKRLSSRTRRRYQVCAGVAGMVVAVMAVGVLDATSSTVASDGPQMIGGVPVVSAGNPRLPAYLERPAPVLVRNLEARRNTSTPAAQNFPASIYVAQRDDHGRALYTVADRETLRHLGEEKLIALAKDSLARANVEAPSHGKDSAYAPLMDARSDYPTKDGVSFRKDVTVVRELRKQGDRFRVLVRDVANVQFDFRQWRDWWREHLNVAGSVSVHSGVGAPRGDSKPLMINALPESDGRTDIELTDSLVQKTGFSVGAGLEGTEGNVLEDLTAKAQLSFSFNRTAETTQKIKWSIKDYTIAASAARPDREDRTNEPVFATTETHLSKAVLGQSSYFRGDHDFTLSQKRVTPWMQRQTIEKATGWTVPADTPSIALASHVAYDHARFSSKEGNFESWPEPRTGYEKKSVDFPGSVIDLTEPYLTSAPSVRIQSADGIGGVLGSTDGSSVTLGNPQRELDKSFLWYLDDAGRYIHVDTEKALTRQDGKLVLEKASLANSQKWGWRADRLHSESRSPGDATTGLWRMENDDGRPVAASGVDCAVNGVYSSILPAWSSYPGKVLQGDTIPNPGGVVHYVQKEVWMAGYEPKVAERWTVTLFRAGL